MELIIWLVGGVMGYYARPWIDVQLARFEAWLRRR